MYSAIFAVPLASRHLADQGARIIKAERRDGGDFARHWIKRSLSERAYVSC
ncbi:CoA transferase [Caballeronia udeis]|uniref:CoA transferase n=1 Tax=Caballeronia udeis TaxID=1232866 RepID=UPI000A8EFE91|nr:CoA transferase [Caballeronia udeis]